MGPPPAVADCRRAVRSMVAGLPRGSLVFAACSGGADSMALAASLLWEAPRAGVRAGVVTVDHGLAAGSGEQAARVATWAEQAGAAPVAVVRVTVGSAGGPEAAARSARYAALAEVADRYGALAVLVGHTRDDQAETVLLGLARGSGARSLAGMARCSGRVWRPFLALPREATAATCAALDLPVWHDGANDDPRFARTRIRTLALPALEQAAGPAVSAALARTAELLRDDADALDELAAQLRRAVGPAGPGPAGPASGLAVAELAAAVPALRRRVLRAEAVAAGVPPGRLTAAHLAALDALLVSWRGQGPVSLPGGFLGVRRCDRLSIVPSAEPSSAPPSSAPPSSAPPSSAQPPSGQPAAAAPGLPADVPSPTVPVPATAEQLRPDLHADIAEVVVSQAAISRRIGELAAAIDGDYGGAGAGSELVLVGVLKGACMVMADLARALETPVTMDFMAVTSYGSSTSSSGVVRILKDLDRDITDAHVLVVEDIIDSGLTLSWLLRNLQSRSPRSVEVCALLRKPDAVRVDTPVRYVGFDIPNAFVVGYGLDYAQRYRNLPFVGLLRPEVYAR